MKVTVIGLGHVGTVVGVGLALSGHEVLATDIDPHKLRDLRAGEYGGFEPGLSDLLKSAVAGGHIRFRHCEEVDEGLGQVALVAVGTPPGEGYSVELGQVEAAVRWVRELSGGDLVVAMKSTVPPGTGRRFIHEYLAGTSIGYAANPEFLRAGQAVSDWQSPDRIVIGTAPGDTRSLEFVRSLYHDIEAPVVATDITSLCDSLGASVDGVREGLALDSRSGAEIFPGVGYGGPCLPKDIGALARLARQADASADLLRAVIDVNEQQWCVPLRALHGRFGDKLKGLRIGILGLAFKPGTADLTEAPGVKLAHALAGEGAVLTAYDPGVKNDDKTVLPEEMRVAPDIFAATRQAQGAVVMTEWNEIVEADWSAVSQVMSPPRFIFDGRNALDPEAMRKAGFEYVGVGRGSQIYHLDVRWSAKGRASMR